MTKHNAIVNHIHCEYRGWYFFASGRKTSTKVNEDRWHCQAVCEAATINSFSLFCFEFSSLVPDGKISHR